MSSRRVISAKAPGTHFKPKSSLVATGVRPSAHDGASEAKEEPSSVTIWWRENADQLSTGLSVISLLCLYGLTFYVPYLGSKSTQLMICTALFTLSLFNFSNFLSAKEQRKAENSAQFRFMPQLPRNVKKNIDGTYSLWYWKPPQFSETLFLNYNPMVPVLAYLWVRSFEAFASWLCLGLMGVSTLLLHILNVKLRWLAKTEAMFRTMKAETGGAKIPEETELEDAKLHPIRGYESNAIETPSQPQQRDNHRYDGPTNAIFQIPVDDGTQRSPIRSNELQYLGKQQEPQRQPYQPRRTFENSPQTQPPTSHHQQLSPTRHSPQINMDPMVYGMEGEQTPSRAAYASRLETPSTAPKRTPFGLRFGASASTHLPPQSPYYNMSAQAQEAPSEVAPQFDNPEFQPEEHDLLQRTPFHQLHEPQYQPQQQTPTSAYGQHGRPFGQTPSKSSFAPPPRFSMQDL